MNRLILIGNGFDLAHGIQTGYNDFIKWYFKQCLVKAETGVPSDDPLVKIVQSGYPMPGQLKNIDGYLAYFYEIGLDKSETASFKLKGYNNDYQNPFTVVIKTKLADLLLQKCSYTTWVEIENDFYDCLTEILKSNKDKQKELDELNGALEFIIAKLSDYLSSLKPEYLVDGYPEILQMPFRKTDFVPEMDVAERPEHTMILNFNYTDTVENYFRRHTLVRLPVVPPMEVNYIHGKLDDPSNPLIFGFGDELDDNYRIMELERTKGFLKYIKSFWYFRTSNYHDLLRFTQSAPYQVFVLGHSCGLSDRTMLNMLFEHENCKSIRIFYYQKGDFNNYDDLTYEISRHFNNKVRMRQVIVSKDKSTPMPQVKTIEDVAREARSQS